MATTNQYVQLAGLVFRAEAAALEERLLGDGGRKFYRPDVSSATSPHRKRLNKPVRERAGVERRKRWI